MGATGSTPPTTTTDSMGATGSTPPTTTTNSMGATGSTPPTTTTDSMGLQGQHHQQQQQTDSMGATGSTPPTTTTDSMGATGSTPPTHLSRNTNTSCKYDNITYKVQSGSPTVYQLRTKKEKIGTLTRMTLGEKDPNKINKTILLVGETGTGKSTLINTLVNYTMGVEWEDDVWFKIVEEEKRRQSESQTSDVIVYQIFGFEDKTLPYSLTIIDTPGYGDTRGIEQDEIISQRLLDWFQSEDGVHEINAVGLVVKGSVNQLSDRLSCIFNSVISPFGKNIEENIVALVTHSDGLTPENVLQALKDANIKCAKDEDDEPVHFMFNNHQKTQKTKKNKVALKAAWDLSMNQMGEFADFLTKQNPQTLMTTVEVMKSQIRLTACIDNMQERIKEIDLKQTEIQQTQEVLKKHEEEMKKNEKFTVEVDEPYKAKQRVVRERRWWALGLNYGGAVCCTVCEENCHYPCTLALYPVQCEVIKDGHCTVCTGKCPASVHVKEEQCIYCEGECSDESRHPKNPWIYVTKTRKVQKTLEDIKEKYEKNKAGGEIKLSLLETLEKNMEELQKEKDQLLEKSFQHVVHLEQIALNVNSLSTRVHLDFLIEKMKEKGDAEKERKLEEMKSQMDKKEGIKAALRYKFGKLREAMGVGKI
ncbi:uncharacterized protein LOC114571057 [Perca flavescens]|uniref:uncharacterized protein LOC114571057 n=1 Tax=Perca flavescens TaxID=8167 RepID=UPI00106E8C63|nr:uncharacterized protein LOC114571057 [Perca flavescens]